MASLDAEDELRRSGYTIRATPVEMGDAPARYAANRSCEIPSCDSRLSRYNPDSICAPCSEKARHIGERWLESNAFETLSSEGKDKALASSPRDIGIKILLEGERTYTAHLQQQYGFAQRMPRGLSTEERYRAYKDYCDAHGIPTNNHKDNGHWQKQIRCMSGKISERGLSGPFGKEAKSLSKAGALRK